MDGLPFLPREIIWCTTAPCPKRVLVLWSDARERVRVFVGLAGHPVLGTGIAIYLSVHRSSLPRGGRSSSSSWSSFYYSWVAGNISRMQLLDYATREDADTSIHVVRLLFPCRGEVFV